jgi:hypothetical protein
MSNNPVVDYVISGVVIFLVGAAAFIAGRLLNQRVERAGISLPMAGGEQSVFITVNPAPELPTTRPEVTGLFVERQDNTVIVSSISLPAGGVYWAGAGVPEDDESGPKLEVVVASETIIYRETTELNGSLSNGHQTIQQTVAAGSLDDLNRQSFITVWGRKSGDRIIATILFYTSPVTIQSPEPEPD